MPAMVGLSPQKDLHPRHIVAVSGLVTDDYARILLVKGDRRGWEPPGGQVELGEDLPEALKREVREESGVEVEVGRLVGVYSNLGRAEVEVPEQINFSFLCKWISGKVRAGDECTEADWFAAEDALRFVEAPQQRGKLEDALDAREAYRSVRYRSYRTYPYEVSHEQEW